MKDRIILLIKAKNLTAAQFADEIGVQKSSISHIISGRNNASLDFIQKVLLCYPEVNMDWLMFGKGPLFRGTETAMNASTDAPLNVVSVQNSASVDLFSELNPANGSEFRKELDLNIETATLKNSTNENIETDELVTKQEEKIQPADSSTWRPENIIKSSRHEHASPKIIIKIVEFYSDNTYREYFPE
jgi:transcriptional regulator with XRE-family HTH domain